MIRCACIRGNYNIVVKALDKKDMVYQDFSDWMTEDRYIVPDEYYVTMIPPGESVGVTLQLKVFDINRISQDEVGLIKDGVWCFQTESCGVKYKKSVGIFYSIECCIRRAYATEPERRYEAIKEVERFVNLSKVAVELNNLQEAMDLLELAQDKMDRIKCDCDC